MYLSYDEYRQDFGGGLSEAEYNKAAAEAEAVVTYYTYLRGDIFADERPRTVSALKQALAKSVDIVAAQSAAEASGQSDIKSESNDGYSVSRVVERKDGETSEDIRRRKIYSVMRTYLLPTGWLSRKVNMCGGCCI